MMKVQGHLCEIGVANRVTDSEVVPAMREHSVGGLLHVPSSVLWSAAAERAAIDGMSALWRTYVDTCPSSAGTAYCRGRASGEGLQRSCDATGGARILWGRCRCSGRTCAGRRQACRQLIASLPVRSSWGLSRRAHHTSTLTRLMFDSLTRHTYCTPQLQAGSSQRLKVQQPQGGPC